MPTFNRTILVRVLAAAAVVGAFAASTAVGGSHITKARLERSLPQTFANLYVQQAAILGHRGITTQSLHARASCDKGGPKKPDVGPGADWICLMNFTDPNVPLPDGTAKFELNVHSNDCYTAGGPSKYIGLVAITDTRGKDVDNPVFEFDACFDPASSDAPTGVAFAKPASAGLSPSEQSTGSAALTLPTGTMAASADGTIAPTITCSVGKDGCGGTITAVAGKARVDVTYALGPDDHAPVTLPLPKGTTGPVTLTAEPVIGMVSTPRTSVQVEAGR